MRKDYLLSPGPTQVPPDVALAGSRQIYHHRTPKFSGIVREVSEGLKYLFCTKNDVYSLTASGTGAMEAAVTNILSPGDRAIVVECGKFGERWTKICRAYGINPVVIRAGYGEVITPEQLGTFLRENSGAKAVFTQSCETATGVLMDIKGFGAVMSKTDSLLVVDGISGIGSDEFKMDEWHVDVAISGSQKGFMMPPGLSFIAASNKAWALVERSTLPKFYFDLKVAKKELGNDTTPWTPAISLFMQLKESLNIIKKETIEGVWLRHAWLANATRAGVKAIELELLAKRPSNALTAVKVPRVIDGSEFVKTIRDKYGVTFAGGQGELKGNIFRISHLGYADRMDVIIAISAVEMALQGAGYPVKLGAGVAAAEKILSNNPY